ncbi:MAG: class II glutamine amidotransferase [Kiloniellales bacterium]|nr:class II glutamine amidotransferase [Kiloniellales bacterium]
MCRLYGFRATEESKVECTLVHAQNALMVQSLEDLKGYTHAHGWGVAAYEDHRPLVEKEAWAAYHGEHFHRAAARIYARTVLAHVRRATVGLAIPDNTHPFVHETIAFAHNGTVPHFDALRPRFLNAMSDPQRAALRGTTDSEHVFRLLMTLRSRSPDLTLAELLRQGARLVFDWCQARDPAAKIGLNLLMTDGAEIAGTRIGRGLFYVERDGVYDCEICGFPHIHHVPSRDYRAVVVASEPITRETWQEVPADSLIRITPQAELVIQPL